MKRKDRLKMDKAKKMTVEELKDLPWGGVVWCEDHGEYDCGKYGIVNYYHIFPMMLTFSACDRKVLIAGEGFIDDIEMEDVITGNIPKCVYCFWNSKPDLGQIEPGRIPFNEAMDIFNKYEKEVV